MVNRGKGLNFKITFITILCLLIGAFSAGVFNIANNQNHATKVVAANTNIENVENDADLILSWSKNKIQTLASSSDDKTYENRTEDPEYGESFTKAYHFVLSKNFAKPILGGTKISVDPTNLKINFDENNDGNTDYNARCDENNGYKITGFSFGYATEDGEIVFVLGCEFNANTTESSVKFRWIDNEVGGVLTSLVCKTGYITPEEIDENYNGTLVFATYYTDRLYSLDMYYEKVDERTGLGTNTLNETPVEAYPYSIKRTLDITQTKFNPPTTPTRNDGKSFGYWVFNSEDVDTFNDRNVDKITLTPIRNRNGDVEKIQVYRLPTSGKNRPGYFNLTFKVDTEHAYPYYDESKSLYCITSVKGWGSLDVVQGDPNDDDFLPFIVAKYSNEYLLTIRNDATNSLWNNNGVSLTDDSGKDLMGARSSFENDENNLQTYFKIKNNSNYQYPFFFTERYDGSGKVVGGKAFLKEDEFTNTRSTNAAYLNEGKWYYVFNYGYRIKGWTISCQIDSRTYYFYYDEYETNSDWKWKFTTTPQFLGEEAVNTDTRGLTIYAEQLDYFLGIKFDVPNIVMTPVWEAVKVLAEYDDINVLNVKADSSSELTPTFNCSYVMTNIGSPNGKSLFSYKYNDFNGDDVEKLISLRGQWNYKNIPSDKYTFDNSTGEYTISVIPVYVDNIYRINLNEIKMTTNNTYEMLSTDYNFTDSKNYISGKYTHETYADSSYVFTYYTNGFIDDYITRLREHKTNYESGIAGRFEIFRKVYADDLNNSIVSITDNLITTNSKLEFYIYLANGQDTGDLPVFLKDYYSLIFWENYYLTENDECYAYPTKEFKKGAHDDELSGFKTRDKGSSGFEKVWYYDDGYNTSDRLDFTAHYFRKSYNLDISTYLGTTMGRYGYVYVEIFDSVHASDNEIADVGGKYIVIFENNQMMIFDVTNLSSTQSLVDNYGDVIYNYADYEHEKIRLYAGCDLLINVRDQSKDVNAMRSGNFDEMIGYKFKKSMHTLRPIFATEAGDLITESSQYTYAATAPGIEDLDYANLSNIKIDFYFDYIIYNMDIKIDNAKAGEFNTRTGSSYSGYKTSYTLQNMKVGNFHQVEYYAYAGFEFEDSAFVIRHTTGANVFAMPGIELQSYADSQDQIYTISKGANTLNGTWLREYIYNYIYTDYALDGTTLGTMCIMTCSIEFNYGIKIYDETDTAFASNGYIIETIDGLTTLQLSDDNVATDLTRSVGDDLAYNGQFYYYESIETINYALLSTRLYYPGDYLTKNNNYYVTYSFLLTTQPDRQYEISSYHLAYMVNNFEGGKIIANDDRNIYMLFEVRKLYSIDMKVERVANDTNSTVRRTSIETGNNNKRIFEIAPEATYDGRYYNNTTGSTTITLHTYHGLKSTVMSTFDSNRYNRVEYYVDGELLTSNEFTTIDNTNLVVKFIPEALSVNIVYNLDGSPISREQALQYIANETTSQIPGVYYIYSEFAYSANVINNDYNANLTINGVLVDYSTANESKRYVSAVYTVYDADYNQGGMNVVVDLIMKDNSKIRVQYQLYNSSKRCVNDNPGTFNLYENTSLKAQDVSYFETSIIENREVSVKLNLNAGYVYKGVVHGNGMFEEIAPLADGSIILVEQYNTDIDYGDYIIFIDKVQVNAVLSLSGSIGKAQYRINGKTSLNDLYVGKTIQFTHIDVNEERLQCFYYLDKRGNKVYLTNNNLIDGDPVLSLEVTSNLLDQVGGTTINFGVVSVNRYKLTLDITGREYLAEGGLKVKYSGTNADYELGTYCDVNTELQLEVNTLIEGKYNIIYNDVVYDVINGEAGKIILNKDCDYTIVVEPKTYSVNINEYLYTTLKEVQNSRPSIVDAQHQVNASTTIGQKYNESAILEFVRITNDQELSTIFIDNNDNSYTIRVDFNGTTFEAYLLEDGKDAVAIDLASYGYSLEFTSYNTVKVNYTTYNNIAFRFDYKLYKLIESN